MPTNRAVEGSAARTRIVGSKPIPGMDLCVVLSYIGQGLSKGWSLDQESYQMSKKIMFSEVIRN